MHSADHSLPPRRSSLICVLYTRRGCHLCDTARDVLEQHHLSPACVDIDADPQLRARFDACVPVVEINGKIRFRGAIEPVLLRRLLRHAQRWKEPE